MACKKPLCGCSPEMGPELHLGIKNSASDDLLNTNTNGSFQQNKISIYKKDSNGAETAVYFTVVPASAFGTDFKYNTISAYAFGDLLKSGKGNIYLKLGDNAPYELNIQLDSKGQIGKLLIDNIEAEKDDSAPTRHPTVFYLTK